MDELAEDQHLLALGQERFQKFEEGLGLPRESVVAHQLRVAADLAQPGEGGQHVHLALGQALLGDALEHLIAAAAQFGQVELALFLAQDAVAAFLDAVREGPWRPGA